MFFENLAEVEQIAARNGCAVFVVPETAEVPIRGAITLAPEEKATISIEQVRNVLEGLNIRQTADVFIVIRPADKLTEQAENAILKSLEEPREKVHFILITDKPSVLLSTILSRAAVYVWRGGLTPVNEIRADDKIKDVARKLLTARSADLPELAEEITKKKDGVREYALYVLGTAVEMAYKSYFITGKPAFLSKIPGFLAAYDNIAANGHIKLHLVADLI